LEKEPERRYQSASQVKSAVETLSTQSIQAPSPVVPTAPVAPQPPEERIHKQVKLTGIGLAFVACFNWLMAPVCLFLVMRAWATMDLNGRVLSKLTIVSLLATPFVLCSLNIYAALRMMRLEAYGAALVASILAMLVPPGNLLGFPIGIWSLVVLARPEVREAFQKRRASLAASSARHSAKTPLWFWLLAAAPVVAIMVVQLVRSASILGGDSVPFPTLGHGGASSSGLTMRKSFNPPDKPISGELTITEDNAWAVSCTTTQTVRLFEVPNPGVERCVLTYRAKLKSEGLVGHAYLEMWCQVPGIGESFSRGLDNTISGSSGWATCQTPFFLKAGEKPDLIRLNLVVEGRGKVFIKDIELTSNTKDTEIRVKRF
jgi:hypothetical protein